MNKYLLRKYEFGDEPGGETAWCLGRINKEDYEKKVPPCLPRPDIISLKLEKIIKTSRNFSIKKLYFEGFGHLEPRKRGKYYFIQLFIFGCDYTRIEDAKVLEFETDKDAELYFELGEFS